MAVIRQEADLDFGGIGRIIRALMNPVTSDPITPVNGELWYNSTDGALRARIAGDTVDLGEGGGGDTFGTNMVYVHDGSGYVLTGGRTFVGTEDPVADGFTMADGDEWLDPS